MLRPWPEVTAATAVTWTSSPARTTIERAPNCLGPFLIAARVTGSKLSQVQDEIGAVVDLLSHPGFLTGLGIGLAAAAFLLGAKVSTGRSPDGWGLAFASAVALGVFIRFDVDPSTYLFVGGLALVGMAGDAIIERDDEPSGAFGLFGYWVAALVLAFGLVFILEVGEVEWAPFFLPLVIAGSGVGIWLLGRSDVAEVVGPMVAISVAGMWITVPETDMITVLVGAAIPFGLVTLRPLRARAWVAGSLALSGMMAWLVFFEGIQREWTIAAAWATLATLPVLGIFVRIRPRSYNMYLVLGIHLVYVVMITRVADITDSTIAVAAATLVLCVSAGVLAFLLARLYEPVGVSS